MKISGAAITNKGCIRTSNQDCIVASSWLEQRSMSVPYVFSLDDAAGDVLLVADGMGGHKAGEIASNFVGKAFLANDSSFVTSEDIQQFLKQVNRDIFTAAEQDEKLAGMGTTVAGLAFQTDTLFWFNVGDSRLFRYRDNFLRQLSVDDVSRRVTLGARKPGITQAIGGASEFVDMDPHIDVEPLVPGWRYLLCSDGLTDVVPTSTIEEFMVSGDEKATIQLLEQAISAGAPDNVSIILVTIGF